MKNYLHVRFGHLLFLKEEEETKSLEDLAQWQRAAMGNSHNPPRRKLSRLGAGMLDGAVFFYRRVGWVG